MAADPGVGLRMMAFELWEGTELAAASFGCVRGVCVNNRAMGVAIGDVWCGLSEQVCACVCIICREACGM